MLNLNFEDSFDVITQFNAKRTSTESETRTHSSGKDYTYVKTQCLAAMGWVGLEFDQVDQIKNLIEEVTGDYNKRVIDYLESALARLSQLKFCSLPIRNELEECIASVHEQNRLLKEYVLQLEDYVRLVNETEDSIVEQLSNIEYDCAIPTNIPICEVDTSKQVTVVDGSAITLDVDAGDVEGAEDDSNIPLDIFQGVLDLVGLIPVVGEPADAINAGIYLARGDKLNAALSASACIPLVGDFATGGKFVNKGVKAVKAFDKAVDIGEVAADAAKEAKIVETVKDGVEVANKSKKVAKETEKAVEVIEGGSDFGKYTTAIDDKVTAVDKVELPESLAKTFTDSEYRTVVTNEDITLYRDFGYKAKANGGFTTTLPAESAIQVKNDSAILPEWKNTLQYEAEIVVPKSTTLQVGKVAPQVTKGGTVLSGGADQIILPQGWDDATWIKNVRELSIGGK